MFFTSGKNIFCFRAAKFVSATYVSWWLNWEAFASAIMFPQLCFLVSLITRDVAGKRVMDSEEFRRVFFLYDVIGSRCRVFLLCDFIDASPTWNHVQY